MGNSTSVKPGQILNPHGRPKKGTALTDLLRTYLDEPNPETKLDRKKALIVTLYNSAICGDTDMIKYIFDRIDGKPDIYKHIEDLTIPQIIIAPMPVKKNE